MRTTLGMLLALLFVNCNDPPPAPRPWTPATKAATKPATPTAAEQATLEAARTLVAERLSEHEPAIEAAFATYDCGTIALKRKLVEDPTSYEPELPKTLVGDQGVRHNKWDEYAARYEALGCNLNCDPSSTVVSLDQDTTQTLKGVTDPNTGTVCYRLRNALGDRLLSVRARIKGKPDAQETLEMYIPTPTGEGNGENAPYDQWATFEVKPVTAIQVQISSDGVHVHTAAPFTLELTPITGSAPPPTPAKTAAK